MHFHCAVYRLPGEVTAFVVRLKTRKFMKLARKCRRQRGTWKKKTSCTIVLRWLWTSCCLTASCHRCYKHWVTSVCVFSDFCCLDPISWSYSRWAEGCWNFVYQYLPCVVFTFIWPTCNCFCFMFLHSFFSLLGGLGGGVAWIIRLSQFSYCCTGRASLRTSGAYYDASHTLAVTKPTVSEALKLTALIPTIGLTSSLLIHH